VFTRRGRLDGSWSHQCDDWCDERHQYEYDERRKHDYRHVFSRRSFDLYLGLGFGQGYLKMYYCGLSSQV
jgi:hypothetical protein